MPREKKPPRLWQRKDGAWLILDNGSQYGTGTRSERGGEAPANATRALAAHLVKRTTPAPDGPQQPSEITVGHVLALYADHAADHVQSRQTLAYSIKALSPFWADKTCDAVKASTCRSYLKGRGTAPGTVRRELSVLQAALNHAHREGVLIYPLAVTLPPSAPPRERWLTRNDVAKILRQSPPHLRRFILLSVYTGTRMSAVLSLRWTTSTDSGWIDTTAGVMHRRGAREAESNKRRGSVRLTPQLHSHVRRWVRAGGSHVIMFRGKPVHSIKKALAVACDRAGLDGVTPHVLKHTAVTWAFQGGMSREDATDYFSTSAQTLEAVYRQHSPDYQSRAVDVMSRRKR